MSLSTDSSTPVDGLKWFEIRGRFQATDIEDALRWLGEYDPTSTDWTNRPHEIEVLPLHDALNRKGAKWL